MKFLVIDDDICIYSLLRKQVKAGWNNSVIEHYNPALEGIPSFDFKWYDYDIVLLDYDIGLSNFNGLDILSRLESMNDLPILIMITGEGNENVAVKAIQAGADDYLIKYDIVSDRFYKVIGDAITLRKSLNSEQQKIANNAPVTEDTTLISDTIHPVLEQVHVPGYRCLNIISNNVSMTVRALRESDSLPVALKLQRIDSHCNTVAVKRFNRELDLLSKLEHPNVIKIIDHGITDQFVFYSMEYIEHGDMYTLLKKGPVRIDMARGYFLEILNGIKALHHLKIIHRDIKASNILFRARDIPVIADLGSARKINEISEITIHGEVVGTPYYMSPEQFNGEQIDYRSDIYSLGVLFYEMIVGQKPFTGNNIMELVFKQAYEKPAQLPENLKKYHGFINKMLAIERNQRYQNIDEVISALDEIH